LASFFDLSVEAELLDDVARTLGEPGDVRAQVRSDLVRVVEQLGERELAGVVELLAGHLAEHQVDVVDAALHLLVAVKHGVFGGFQHAVQTADHGEGHDDFAVFRLLVIASEEVCYRPDERRVVLDDRRVRHWAYGI